MSRRPRLTAYMIGAARVPMRPAPADRLWMDHTPDRFAYRCLPLVIANTWGWELLLRGSVTATWDGTAAKEGITLEEHGDGTSHAVSHFGSGVLTFHVGALFRTEPHTNLFVTGPLNRPKDGIAPLTGIVETDWTPFTFTMNWRFTRSGHPVRFLAGEPFCHVFPVRRGEIERVDPVARSLRDDPDLATRFHAWSTSRSTFLRELPVEGSDANRSQWQRAYTRGVEPDGSAGAHDHQMRVRPRPFRWVDEGEE